jgi:hypothetical protein
VSEDAKSPLEQAIELLVYAPLGLVLTARDELPRLIDKGRERVTGQVAMAKMMGQFAVAQGQKEAEKVVKQATETLAGVTGSRPVPNPSRPSTAPSTAATSAAPSTAPATAATTASSAASPPSPSAANGSAVSAAAQPPVADNDLAIPGYGALSASQVVQRLAGLSGAELEAVRAYEAATRGRKTILHRVEQLQAAATA